MITYFDGEIIGSKHPFLTRKWDADEQVDIKHWGKFDAFNQKNYNKKFNTDNFNYDELAKSDYVYMRWKVCFSFIHFISTQWFPPTFDSKISFYGHPSLGVERYIIFLTIRYDTIRYDIVV